MPTSKNPGADPGDRLLRVRETAEILAISERQVWNLIRAGKLEVVRLGRSTRLRASQVLRLVQVGSSSRGGSQ